ncbi:ESCRT-II complex subunit VPS36, partial [Phenoliferia sp. Uapishka_3]
MFKLNSISLSLQTINAQLYPNEKILIAQDNVGLYDGKEKSPAHTSGRLHLTTHRLLYLDALSPLTSSLSLPLSLVRQTEYWVGFINSSPKITLLLGEAGEVVKPITGTEQEAGYEEETEGGQDRWVCRVCGMRNVRGGGGKCGLCGVMRDPVGGSGGGGSGNTSRSATPTLRERDRPPSSNSMRDAPPTSSRPSPPPPLPPFLASGQGFACPTCTFLNHPSMKSCEVCDSPLSSAVTPPSRISTPAPSVPPPTLTPNPDMAPFVRLSFRKGGVKPFYAALKTALVDKAWEDKGKKDGDIRAGVGIDAIMRGMDEEARGREGELDDAFKDLNALMAKAKEMITLAQSMNERISSQPSQAQKLSGGETTLVRSSLVNLGLPAEAVTQDMVRDEQHYHAELAKELATILRRKDGVLKDGLVGLDEVWCVWNRARGVALVSPKDLRLTAPFLSTSTPRIFLRTFSKSGLTVLHTSRFTRSAFLSRLLDTLDLRRALAESFITAFDVERSSAEREGITTLELAQSEGVALNLAKEMVEELEIEGGEIVRDDQGGEGIRWFRNHIVEEGLRMGN